MTKQTKKFKHIEPAAAKALAGTVRKEVLLTAPIIKLLTKKASNEGENLKRYMEKVLIKVAFMPEFLTDINI